MNASRRDWLLRIARSFGREHEREEASASANAGTRVAIIQGRLCLALTSFCAACVERCPVPGAMRTERGMPMVVADLCTGCGVCRDVCPAPVNAVLFLPRRRVAQTTSA